MWAVVGVSCGVSGRYLLISCIIFQLLGVTGLLAGCDGFGGQWQLAINLSYYSIPMDGGC